MAAEFAQVITLGEGVTEVKFNTSKENFAVRNDGPGNIWLGLTEDVEPNGPDVLYIPAKQSAVYPALGVKKVLNTLYMTGDDGTSVTVMLQYGNVNPFKSISEGGGGGGGEGKIYTGVLPIKVDNVQNKISVDIATDNKPGTVRGYDVIVDGIGRMFVVRVNGVPINEFVNNLIEIALSNQTKVRIEIVEDELPDEGEENVIYWVPVEGTNHYEQWYYDGTWHDLGTTEVSLEIVSRTKDGLVPKGEGNENKIFRTDALGNPYWGDIPEVPTVIDERFIITNIVIPSDGEWVDSGKTWIPYKLDLSVPEVKAGDTGQINIQIDDLEYAENAGITETGEALEDGVLTIYATTASLNHSLYAEVVIFRKGVTKKTPAALGYVEENCQNFFDGIYNTGYEHSNSAQSNRYWFDLMGNGILRRCHNGDYPDMEENCYTTEKGYFPSVLRMDEAISFQQSFTYEVVFRCTEWPSSASTAYMVISNTNARGAGLQFNYHEIQFILHNGSTYIIIGAPEDAYKDVFVVAQMTYGDGIAKLYLNGEFIGSDSVPSIKHTTEPIYIGCNGGETEYQGAMKAYRVALYDRPLTEEELMQNYRKDLERFHS